MQAGQPITFNGSAGTHKIVDLETIETTGAALTIEGLSLNLNSTQDATFTGPKLVINGNVDIQGTLNSISSTQVTFDDSTILLNSNKPNTETASSSDPDAGFEVNRGANTNVSFLWNETNDNWLLTGGPLNMGGSLKITGLADPTNDADAANKKYVNDEDAALLTQVLQLSGGTMTGALNMSSQLNMGNQKIISLATPTAATDAATMGYVDDANTAMTTFVTDSIATANSAMTAYVDGKVGSVDFSTLLAKDGSDVMSGALDMGNNDISNANNIIATNILIGANQVLHAGNLPITANTVDGDTIYTFAAL